ncbi:MAG: ABC transporter permease [Verrucomicrobiae bacterium]|nr:ABC transporter permease [Verrucomicrobiae bacterium]
MPAESPGFFAWFVGMAVLYAGLIVAMIFADLKYALAMETFSFGGLGQALAGLWVEVAKPEILFSIRLTLITCTLSALLSVFFAIPIAYLLARHRFPLRSVFDALLDIPIVLPPLVIGLSLLILFHQVNVFGDTIESWCERIFGTGVTFRVPAVVLAQFTVACAFAIRAVKATMDQIDPRPEQVALTLGCTRAGAFWMVLLPQCWRGVLTGGTLAWARALGEFGPILVFAGATRGRTEVLSTSVFLEINIGNLRGAVAVSLLMIVLAIAVILIIRSAGSRSVRAMEEGRGR